MLYCWSWRTQSISQSLCNNRDTCFTCIAYDVCCFACFYVSPFYELAILMFYDHSASAALLDCLLWYILIDISCQRNEFESSLFDLISSVIFHLCTQYRISHHTFYGFHKITRAAGAAATANFDRRLWLSSRNFQDINICDCEYKTSRFCIIVICLFVFRLFYQLLPDYWWIKFLKHLRRCHDNRWWNQYKCYKLFLQIKSFMEIVWISKYHKENYNINKCMVACMKTDFHTISLRIHQFVVRLRASEIVHCKNAL